MTATVDAAVEALGRTQEGAFSIWQAYNRGATNGIIRNRVTAGRWLREDTGVLLLPGWPSTFRQKLFVAVLAPPTSGYVSHEAAAMVRGLDAIRSARVEVTLPPYGGRRSGRGIVYHRTTEFEDRDWSMVGALPVASAARIIADLAPMHDVLTLERVYESAARKGLIVPSDLDDVVARFATPHRRGADTLRKLQATIVRDGMTNDSDFETLFFQLLRAAGIRLPVRQRRVLRPDGRLAYADYAWPDLHIVVELQGFEYHASRYAHLYDVERNNDLVVLGWNILEFAWTHLSRPGYIVATILALAPELAAA
ncbi:MAG TPA: hypothetical protein VHN98_13190 [Acidimicrobiales bacterium]|nr:hypothetical protein [Acidimicrobiales bacterium]